MRQARVPIGRLIALDVGSRRIGVAACDERGVIATPLEVIHHTSKVEDLARIVDTVRAEQARGVIVGHPLNEDGSAGPQARYVEQYAAELGAALRDAGIEVPVTLWDEYGSTRRAQQAMITTGRSARKRRERLDAVAAAAILQDYLDAQSPPPAPPPIEEAEQEAPGEPERYSGEPERYSGGPDEW